MGDLLAEVRRRKFRATDSGPKPAIDEKMSQAVVASEDKEAVVSAQPSKPASTRPHDPAADGPDAKHDAEWNSDTEWDVGTSEGCIGFITISFPKAKRSQVEAIARFYAKTELQSKATKSPL